MLSFFRWVLFFIALFLTVMGGALFVGHSLLVADGPLAATKRIVIPRGAGPATMAKVLKEEGYVKNFRLMREEGRPVIKVYLKYTDGGDSVIQGIRRVSRPGLRRYIGYDKMPKPLGGAGVARA